MSDKIKIVLLATSRLGLAYLRLNDEQREIDSKIRSASFRDAFDLIAQPAVRVSDLGGYLLRGQPHIVHFSGHGKPGEGIILEDASENKKIMAESDLTDIFRALNGNLRLVFFNVCYSKPLAEAVIQEVDYAIGMQETIGDQAALIFAPAFYEALAYGRSVDEAFTLAKGLAGASMAVLQVRPGVDATEPFLAQTQRINRLKSAVKRLLDGVADDADRPIIQAAVIGGHLIFTETDDETKGQGEGQQTFQVIRRDGQLQVTLPSSACKQANAWLFPVPPGIAPPFYPSVFIGREDALADLKQLISQPTASGNGTPIVVVRGWPGVGKTTLVGVIGRDPQIAEMFPQGVLWTSLEQKPNLLSEMARWGRALGTDEILRAPTLKEATALLADLLRHRRMLLIVDDVWDTAHAVHFLEAVGKQCALLVTTRMTSVAEALVADEKSIYNLPVLTEEHALALLRVFVPAIVAQYQEECRELIRDLEYLPLALHVAGRLLKSEAKLGWGVKELIGELRQEAILIQQAAPKDRIEGEEIPTVNALLMKSTNMLDEFTRDCFAFLGAFAPKPATFDLAAMKAVWEVDNPKPIVRKLVGHGLLEPVGSGRFQMHRILVDHAKSLCEE